jgi:DNA polymerase alpha subunit B
MFEKITERAAVLDNTIDEAAELIKEYYAIEDFGNPAHPSQDDHYCVGRICPEADGVRLTDTSVQFETSRHYGGAERVGLRFDSEVVVRSSDDPAYSTGEGGIGLFPGMICGLKGRNAGGGYFTVSEVLQVRLSSLGAFVSGSES